MGQAVQTARPAGCGLNGRREPPKKNSQKRTAKKEQPKTESRVQDFLAFPLVSRKPPVNTASKKQIVPHHKA